MEAITLCTRNLAIPSRSETQELAPGSAGGVRLGELLDWLLEKREKRKRTGEKERVIGIYR